MSRVIVAIVMILLLAVLHAPTPAQALLFDLLPFKPGTNEPIALLLTGIALLSLARVGAVSGRAHGVRRDAATERSSDVHRLRPAPQRSSRRAA